MLIYDCPSTSTNLWENCITFFSEFSEHCIPMAFACREDEGEDEGEESEGDFDGGTGMGEGEGKDDVSNEIEDEEQVLGLQGEEQQKMMVNQRTSRTRTVALRCLQTLRAGWNRCKKEMMMKKQNESEEEAEEEEMDREMGDIDDDEENVIDEKLWNDESDDDGEGDDKDEKLRKMHQLQEKILEKCGHGMKMRKKRKRKMEMAQIGKQGPAKE